MGVGNVGNVGMANLGNPPITLLPCTWGGTMVHVSALMALFLNPDMQLSQQRGIPGSGSKSGYCYTLKHIGSLVWLYARRK